MSGREPELAVVTKPRCRECLSEDVTVKLIDLCGFEHWFCAEDWDADRRAHDHFMKFLEDGLRRITPGTVVDNGAD